MTETKEYSIGTLKIEHNPSRITLKRGENTVGINRPNLLVKRIINLDEGYNKILNEPKMDYRFGYGTRSTVRTDEDGNPEILFQQGQKVVE